MCQWGNDNRELLQSSVFKTTNLLCKRRQFCGTEILQFMTCTSLYSKPSYFRQHLLVLRAVMIIIHLILINFH